MGVVGFGKEVEELWESLGGFEKDETHV